MKILKNSLWTSLHTNGHSFLPEAYFEMENTPISLCMTLFTSNLCCNFGTVTETLQRGDARCIVTPE